MSYVIACVDSKSGIGLNNDIPWKHTIDGKDDMKLFRELTKNNAVLMGYNTYMSIGKALPNRMNIIITRTHYDEFQNNKQGLYVFKTLKEGVEFAKEYETKTNKKCFICGGGIIYNTYFDMYIPKEVYKTTLTSDFNCDRFFPSDKMDKIIPTNVELFRYKMFVYSYK